MVLLNSWQKKYKQQFLNKLQRGIYHLRKNSCPCGHSTDIVVGRVDRYGIPLTTVVCEYCGLMRSDPYYDRKTLKNFYNLEYRGIYEEGMRPNQKFFDSQREGGRFIYEYLKRNYFTKEIKDKIVVEVGCSAGGILAYFKTRGNSVFGCDFDSSYVAFGKKKGLNLFVGGAEKLSSLKGRADIVILCHVLEHFNNLEVELEKIRSLIRKDGLLFIAVPGIYLIHRSYGGKFDNFLQNAHAFNFTLRSLCYVLGKSKFKLVSGDESVFAIFKKTGREILGRRENYKSVLSYLKRTEKFVPFFLLERWLYLTTEKFLRKMGLLDFTVNAISKARRVFVSPHA